MLIKTSQIQAFSGEQARRFIPETLRRLRETEPLWAAGRSDGELSVVLEDIVAFAAASRIRKRDAVMSVIEAFIRYAPPMPPDQRLVEILRQPNVPESVRAEQFYLCLASGRHRLTEIFLTP